MSINENTYADYAEWGLQKLIENYWNDEQKFINNKYPDSADTIKHLNYWWKAHAVDAMIDGYERTNDEYYHEKAKHLITGIFQRNKSLFNEFYDDMEWQALAILRLYDLTKDDMLKDYAHQLWSDIKTAWWEDEVGGMAWKKDQRHSRNACSSAPGGIVAARMFKRFGDESDLELAKKIFVFMETYLVDPDSGLVYDGLEVQEDGSLRTNKAWLFTYNAGTFIGLAVELYQITKDEAYLKAAEKTSKGSMNGLINDAGVLKDEGQGDGGLFKGILIRYMANLYTTTHDDQVYNFFVKNTDLLIKKGSTPDKGLFGNTWDKIYDAPQDITTQLSAVFMLEAMAKIDKNCE